MPLRVKRSSLLNLNHRKIVLTRFLPAGCRATARSNTMVMPIIAGTSSEDVTTEALHGLHVGGSLSFRK